MTQAAALPSGDPGAAPSPLKPPDNPALVWATILRRWRADPVVFAWEALGIWCWSRQRVMLRTMARNRNVAIRSGQKVSKTLTVVVCALWWLFTKPAGKVFVTSADYRNIKTVFWSELKDVLRRSRVHLGGHCADDPQTGYVLPDGRFIKGFTTDKIEGWGGYSGPQMLFIIDEASAINQQIFEAIDGNRAGGGTLVMIGNPTHNVGPFFDAFHTAREHWALHALASTDSPACTGELVTLRKPDGKWIRTSKIPGMAGPEHVAERLRRYGLHHPFYTVRVQGDFVSNADNAIVPLGLVEAAQARYRDRSDAYLHGEGRLTFGIDPARYGSDDTVMAMRRGRRVCKLWRAHHADTLQIVGTLREAIASYVRKDDTEIPLVNVDCTGGYGAGVVDMAKTLVGPDGHQLCEVCECNSSECADDEDTYVNLRTQLLFAVRTWLESGPCALPWAPSTQEDDDMLAADLVATTYTFDARGRRKAQPKDEVKSMLGRSPDRGDAVALSIYTGARPVNTHRGTGAFTTYDEN